MKKNKSLIAIAISLFLVASPFAAMDAFALADTTLPSTPTNIHATINASNQVSLLWNASTDNNGVTGYIIIKGSSVLANSSATNYTDTIVSPNTNYTYSILAFDAAGNVSAPSTPISITTLVSSDTISPSAPISLTAASTSPKQIKLKWATSTDNIAVTGYNIFRNGSLIGTSTSPKFTDKGLATSTSYTYNVRAYDAAGNISSFSNAATTTTLNTKNKPTHKDDEKESKKDHENKEKHLEQNKEHANNGNHFGQNKEKKNNGNHLGQKKDR